MTAALRTRVVARDAPAYQALLSELGIELDSHPAKEDFVLVEREGRLDLRPPGAAGIAGIRSFFPPDRGPAIGGRNPLVRAFGKKKDPIFDLTAGLGGDAYRLAAAGHRVVAYERHPAVFAVLITGWAEDRAAGRVPSEVAARLEFAHAESAEMLDRIDCANGGIYLDPMYPRPLRAKALPRRELQVLRHLLGEQEAEAVKILESARQRCPRVVVKRPRRARPLVPGVSFEIATKLVRFDVYVKSDTNAGVARE